VGGNKWIEPNDDLYARCMSRPQEHKAPKLRDREHWSKVREFLLLPQVVFHEGGGARHSHVTDLPQARRGVVPTFELLQRRVVKAVVLVRPLRQ